MPAFRYLLLTGAIAMFLAAAAVVIYDLWFNVQYRCASAGGGHQGPEAVPLRWRTSMALVLVAWSPLLIAFGLGLATATR